MLRKDLKGRVNAMMRCHTKLNQSINIHLLVFICFYSTLSCMSLPLHSMLVVQNVKEVINYNLTTQTEQQIPIVILLYTYLKYKCMVYSSHTQAFENSVISTVPCCITNTHFNVSAIHKNICTCLYVHTHSDVMCIHCFLILDTHPPTQHCLMYWLISCIKAV